MLSKELDAFNNAVAEPDWALTVPLYFVLNLRDNLALVS